MRKFLLLFLLLATSFLYAQNFQAFEKKEFVVGNDTMPYRLLLPENYNPAIRYPVILFLHGAGERGKDNELQLVHGARLFLKEEVRKDFPSIVIFPQCPKNSYWSNMDTKIINGEKSFVFRADGEPTPALNLAQQLLYFIIQNYSVEKKQVYVGGLSMGGMGTFEIVRRNPLLFAAAFPICGGAVPETASQLKNVKWWIFHGGKDNVVPPFHSEQMAEALKSVMADVRFTLYPEANHNSWDAAFAEPELLKWLFSQHL